MARYAGMEATHLRKAYKEMKKAGNPITSVYDGEEELPVRTMAEMLEVIYSVDECWLKGEKGGYIYIVLGNDWDEVIADYTTGPKISAAMDSVWEWVQSKQN